VGNWVGGPRCVLARHLSRSGTIMAPGCRHAAQLKPTSGAKASKPSNKAPRRPQDRRAQLSSSTAQPAKPINLGVRDVRPAAGFGRRGDSPPGRDRASDPFALSPAGAYGDAACWTPTAITRAAARSAGGPTPSWSARARTRSTRSACRWPASRGRQDPAPGPGAARRGQFRGSRRRRHRDPRLARGGVAGAGKYALDVTPHAGLGFGGAGGSAEAGATVRLGKKMGDQVVNSLGV
jgi:hypothetical protein